MKRLILGISKPSCINNSGTVKDFCDYVLLSKFERFFDYHDSYEVYLDRPKVHGTCQRKICLETVDFNEVSEIVIPTQDPTMGQYMEMGSLSIYTKTAIEKLKTVKASYPNIPIFYLLHSDQPKDYEILKELPWLSPIPITLNKDFLTQDVLRFSCQSFDPVVYDGRSLARFLPYIPEKVVELDECVDYTTLSEEAGNVEMWQLYEAATLCVTSLGGSYYTKTALRVLFYLNGTVEIKGDTQAEKDEFVKEVCSSLRYDLDDRQIRRDWRLEEELISYE